MTLPKGFYPIHDTLQLILPILTKAQITGLALWIYGTIISGSACQNAVIAGLQGVAGFETLKKRLGETLCKGKDKAAPCSTEIPILDCFPYLMKAVCDLWTEKTITLALDATLKEDKTTALVISVVYRQNAIPVAWAMLPANEKGAWNPLWIKLLAKLSNSIPSDWKVYALCDRGLWSREIYLAIQDNKWHPVMRVQNDLLFRPKGMKGKHRANELLSEKDCAWIGKGKAFQSNPLSCTLVGVWLAKHDEACFVLTDVHADEVNALFYSLRFWIECSFRSIKSIGWNWEQTRRTDIFRSERHFLVLALAMYFTLSIGTRSEDAELMNVCPSRIQRPPKNLTIPSRKCSLFKRGLMMLQKRVILGNFWKNLWLRPDELPQLPSHVRVKIWESKEEM